MILQQHRRQDEKREILKRVFVNVPSPLVLDKRKKKKPFDCLYLFLKAKLTLDFKAGEFSPLRQKNTRRAKGLE